jgi:hypothetical protein
MLIWTLFLVWYVELVPNIVRNVQLHSVYIEPILRYGSVGFLRWTAGRNPTIPVYHVTPSSSSCSRMYWTLRVGMWSGDWVYFGSAVGRGRSKLCLGYGFKILFEL